MKLFLLFRSVLVLPALLVLTTLVYWPGLSGGFIFDDYSTIVQNSRVHASGIDLAAFQRAATSFDPGGTFGSRPLSMASFALNHALGGLDPWGYKLAGLLVHLLNVLLVYALVRRLLTLPWIGGGERWVLYASATVALLWSIHPQQASTVLYVVQRMETLSLSFVLMGILAYLNGRCRQIEGGRGWPWLALCVPLLALGVAAKESAILLPAFTLALEVTVLGFGAARPVVARNWRLLYGVMVLGALLVYFFVVVPHYWRDAHLTRNFGTYERLLSQLRILPMYLGQIVLPVPGSMTFYYDNFLPSRGWLQPVTTLLGGLLLLSMLAVAWVFRNRAPLLSLGIFWFFASHILTSNVVALELVFEHRNYFALLGVILALTELVRRVPMRDGPGLKYFAVAVVVVVFAGLASLRSLTWGNPLLLATELVAVNQNSGRASANLAAIYYDMSDGYPKSPFVDLAMREFERGARLPGTSIVSDQGLILTAARAGRPVPDAWWQRLVGKVNSGTLSPETTGALFGLLGNRLKGVELNDDYLVDAFIALFQRASLPPYSYAQVGDYVLTHVGDQALADSLFVLAVEKSSAHPEFARTVVETLRERGQTRQADAALARARALGLLSDMPVPEPVTQ